MHTSEETQPTPTQVLTHSNPTPELASIQETEEMNRKCETTLAQTTLIRLPKAQLGDEGVEGKGCRQRVLK